MKIDNTNKGVIFMRWVSFLPVAFIAAWLAWIIVNLLGRFSLGFVGITAEDFQGKLYFMTAGHAGMGAAFVYAGARIAPAYKIILTFILGGIAIVISGFLLFPAVMIKDWWAVWGSLFVAIGASFVIWSVHSGQTDIE